MANQLDLTGMVFGRLTARWPSGYRKKSIQWLCSCECGGLTVAALGNLRTGVTRSCGCMHKEMVRDMHTTHGMSKTSEYAMWLSAKMRARIKNLPFDLTVSDIVIPELCPLLEIPIVAGLLRLTDASPSLDRIKAELGYVRGNIQVISYKANRAKNNLSLAEMELLVKNLRKA